MKIPDISALISPYTLYLKIAGLAMLVLFGWYARGVYERAQQVDALNEAIFDRVENEDKSYRIGMDLETGLNKYRRETLQLDRKVSDATAHDTGNRFTADWVQRTKERIAAGEAARKRNE